MTAGKDVPQDAQADDGLPPPAYRPRPQEPRAVAEEVAAAPGMTPSQEAVARVRASAAARQNPQAAPERQRFV